MITILEGDAFTRLRELPPESMHCVVTSPPYYGLRDYKAEGQLGLEKSPEEYVANLVNLFRLIKRVLRKDGTVWLNLGDSYAGSGLHSGYKPKDLIGIPWMVAFALRVDGWWLRSDIVWYKLNGMPNSVEDRPVKTHEYMFLLSKSQRYYYDYLAIMEPCTNGKKSTRNKRTVWPVNTTPSYGEVHFATFPPALIEPCILAGTSEHGACPKCGAPWKRIIKRVAEKTNDREGVAQRVRNAGASSGGIKNVTLGVTEHVHKTTAGWKPGCKCNAEEPVPCIVLDPFAGTGTTMLVAAEYGRDSIGIELSHEYVELIKKRLGKIQLKMTI